MDIATRSVGNCMVLDLTGSLVLGEDTVAVRNAVRAAAKLMPRKIVLNLERVSLVDSCGIGELVNSYTHVKSQGGKLVLLAMTRRIKKLLDIAKLYPVFEVFENEQSALEN
jgi:anti-sigma B factor antagonist